MAKALKIVGLAVAAVGIGLATAGFGAVAFTGVITATISTTAIVGAGLAIEVGATLLSKKGSTTSSQSDRLTTSLDPRAMRKTWLGHTVGGNDLRYEEWFGADQEYVAWIIALASHRIDGVEEIWINQEQAWTATGGVAAKFQGYFFVQKIVTEGSPTNTTVVSGAGKWTTADRLTGCAYAHIQFRVTGVDKKATSPFSGGPPSKIVFIGRGAMLYDPRRDATVPGGAGPMRAADQATWRFTSDDGIEIGRNLPLQILRVLLGWRITNPVTGVGKLAVGCGLPAKRIDLGSFITAANLADELVGVAAGGTEPRFHGAALLSEGDDPHAQLDMLCAACNGRLRDVNGQIALVIMHNDLAGAATDDGLGDDDVIGGFTWESDPPLDQCVNVIRGKFTDPSTTSLYQMIDYPDVSLPSPDGIDRVMTLDLSPVQSAAQAQRIVKQVLERRQYQRTFTAPFDIRAWKYQVGDVVPFTFSPLSFARRLFRVSAQELGQDGTCVMSLMDESPAIYAWDADDRAPVTAAAPIVYDPTKTAVLQAIAALGVRAAYQIVRQTVDYPVSDTSTAIAIAAFDAVLDDGTMLSFPAGSVAATAATSYAVLWDLQTSTYVAAPAPALEQVASSRYVIIRAYTTGNGDGTYPEQPTAPGGDGGGGYGGTGCPVPEALVLLADDRRSGPGDVAMAGALRPDVDWVWSPHEHTGVWAAWPVVAARRIESEIWQAAGRPDTSPSHLWSIGGEWVRMDAIGAPARRAGTVMAITIGEAHTYVLIGDGGEWLVSHNKSTEPTA